MIFNDNFLRAGEAGGERAAVTLLHSVLQWAASNVIDCPKDTKIVVRVYGHLRDLAALLTTTNDIDSATLVEDFFRGFTNGQPLFDFVDIVHNRYGTDVKIFGRALVPYPRPLDILFLTTRYRAIQAACLRLPVPSHLAWHIMSQRQLCLNFATVHQRRGRETCDSA